MFSHLHIIKSVWIWTSLAVIEKTFHPVTHHGVITPLVCTGSESGIAARAETASCPDSSSNSVPKLQYQKSLNCGFKPPEGNTELTFDQHYWATIISSS